MGQRTCGQYFPFDPGSVSVIVLKRMPEIEALKENSKETKRKRSNIHALINSEKLQPFVVFLCSSLLTYSILQHVVFQRTPEENEKREKK